MILDSPFNYTGSKAKLFAQLSELLPPNLTKVYDSFCGGGGFFINLPLGVEVLANDIIEPLIGVYRWLQSEDWPSIEQRLADNAGTIDRLKTDQAFYNQIRDDFNKSKDPFLFLLLVSSCTNNMMRFNKSLGFNQTWGKRTINDSTVKKLKAYHARLYNNPKIRFTSGRFDLHKIMLDEFFYLDPPYLITEAGYNSYWSSDAEARLYDYIDTIEDIGGKFMLSMVARHKGTDNPSLARMSKYRIIPIEHDYGKVARDKSTSTDGEVVVINYDPPERRPSEWLF